MFYIKNFISRALSKQTYESWLLLTKRPKIKSLIENT